MSSKIGTILSMLFVIMFFLFGTDLLCLQYLYSELDSKGITIAYQISKNSRIDRDFLEILANKYDVTIEADPSQSTDYGEIVEFSISDKYDPLIIKSEEMSVTLTREAIIGYYG